MHFITIYGNPLPQPRPKFFRRGNHVGVYDPLENEKKSAKWQIKSQYKDKPLTGALAIDVLFFMPIPQSTSRVRLEQMVQRKIHHIKRPDTDNLLKFVLDVLNEIVYEDDSQIIDLRARKIYGVKPETQISVIPFSDLNLPGTLNASEY